MQSKYSILLVFCIFYSFSCQGMKYILPKTLDLILKEKNPMGNQTLLNNTLKISSMLNGITSFLTCILVECEYFQRLKLLKMLIWISFTCSIFVLFSQNYFVILICLFKSIVIMMDQVIETYASESITTKRRVFFLSILNCLQSLSSFSSALVTDNLLEINYKYNFIMFTVLFMLMIIVSYFFTKEKYKAVIK